MLIQYTALTVCQPWAYAIIHGGKDVENRSWPTSYRGLLAIHAGKSRSWLDPDCPMPDGTDHPPLDKLVFGAVIGIVELVDCLPIRRCKSIWAEGPWCWVLRNARSIEPVLASGQTRLWTWRADGLIFKS